MRAGHNEGNVAGVFMVDGSRRSLQHVCEERHHTTYPMYSHMQRWGNGGGPSGRRQGQCAAMVQLGRGIGTGTCPELQLRRRL